MHPCECADAYARPARAPQALHGENGSDEFSDIPRFCLIGTLISLAINLPRRLSHFFVSSCESAFHERAELADDAQICTLTGLGLRARMRMRLRPRGEGWGRGRGARGETEAEAEAEG